MVVGGSKAMVGDEWPLFDETPSLPNDNALHLIKAVFLCESERCTRSLELDGRTLEESKPMRWKSEATEPVVVPAFALFNEQDHLTDVAMLDQARVEIAEKPDWLFGSSKCPADLMPSTLNPDTFDPEACYGGRLKDCLKECSAGVGPRWY